jgi:hypothetical protein
VRLTTHLHLLARFRLTGVIPVLPLHASTAWTIKTLPFIGLYSRGSFEHDNEAWSSIKDDNLLKS